MVATLHYPIASYLPHHHIFIWLVATKFVKILSLKNYPYMVNTSIAHIVTSCCVLFANIPYMVVTYDTIVYSTGAIVISKLLKDNHVIRNLYMNHNNIGDDGIAAIATALTNSTVRELWVNNCGITLTGARSIATLLSLNHSIRSLRLTSNPITTEGAHFILQSALNNEASQVDIHTDDEYRDSEVRRMKGVLCNRRRMKTNEVVLCYDVMHNNYCHGNL